jgi:hypothetical protein
VGDASGAPGGEPSSGGSSGYSWDRDRYSSPAAAPLDNYPSASPRSGASTAPATTVVTPAPAVVVTPEPAVVVTPGTVVVPNTPLICPNVNPSDPRKC